MVNDIFSGGKESFKSAADAFRKGKKAKLRVYVEDDFDKVFWQRCLEPYSETYEIETTLYDKGNADEDIRGKDILLSAVKEHRLFPSPNILICIDTDYDEYISTNPYSELIQENKFIITTGGWYSIENVKCTPKSVKYAFAKITLADKVAINFDHTFQEVSTLFSPLLIISMVTKNNAPCYSISQFTEHFTLLEFDENGNIKDESRESIGKKVNEVLASFSGYSEMIKEQKEKIAAMGYDDANQYKLMQGHCIEENLCVKLISSVGLPVITEKLQNISKLKGTKDERKTKEMHFLIL